MKGIVKIPTQKIDKLKSVSVMVLGFVILSIVVKWKREQLEFEASTVFLFIASIVGILSLISGFLLDKIIWVWYSIASIIGFIMSRILLTLVYYVFLSPIALLSRLGGKDQLQIKKPEKTAFTERNHVFSKSDVENIW